MEPVLRREGGSSWPAKGKALTRYGIGAPTTGPSSSGDPSSCGSAKKPSGSSSAPILPSPRGHPFVYSHIAIACLLVVRELFRLPYRQLEGVARSIMQCLGLDLPVPDYTTLAKRAARLGAALKVRRRGARTRAAWLPGRRWLAHAAMRRVRDMGRRRWKEPMGYHRRSLVDTAVSRLEGTFGDRLKNRVFATERTEIRLRCEILNRFTQLGPPRFEWV